MVKVYALSGADCFLSLFILITFTYCNLPNKIRILFIVIIAALAVYLLVLLRLRTCFIDSQFSISAKKIYFHISIIILILLTATIAAILDYLLLYLWDIFFYAISIIIYIIGYSHLAYCFNHNLFLLVLSQRSTVIETDINTDHSDLNIRQKKMIQIVVKQTILSCMVL